MKMNCFYIFTTYISDCSQSNAKKRDCQTQRLNKGASWPAYSCKCPNQCHSPINFKINGLRLFWRTAMTSGLSISRFFSRNPWGRPAVHIHTDLNRTSCCLCSKNIWLPCAQDNHVKLYMAHISDLNSLAHHEFFGCNDTINDQARRGITLFLREAV